ncbi:MAG: His/Gly/Thr/Pro-type tRNA ligase C-terminal domain-containing protein, partial [Brevinema sp.]
ATFFNIEPKDLVKAFIVEADGKLVMACIRGDLQVNQAKLKNIIGANDIVPADPERIFAELKAPIGFLGPSQDCPIDVIADVSILEMHDTVMGANEKDMHFKGVSISRDCKITKTGSFHQAEKGHDCVNCHAKLDIYKGIEVGHIFKLGKKYTESMGVTVLDQHNQKITPTCGCYGIGLGRVVAAVVEQGSDDHGIVFPISIAPYHVIITPTLIEGDIFETALSLYKDLQIKQVEVIIDDRNERAGAKFKDADLLGIPIRVTVGKSWLEKQEFEVKIRRTGETISCPKEKIVTTIQHIIQTQWEELE